MDDRYRSIRVGWRALGAIGLAWLAAAGISCVSPDARPPRATESDTAVESPAETGSLKDNSAEAQDGTTEPRSEAEDQEAPPEEPPVGEIVFAGNKAVASSTLRSAIEQELAYVRDRGFRKSGVDDLAYEVERFLEKRGFAFARVSYEYTPERATILVEEGPRVLLERVSFRGNRSIRNDELAKLLPDRRTAILGFGSRIYVARDAEGLAGSVRRRYIGRGFSDVMVEEPVVDFSEDRRTARVTVSVEEGPRYVVAGVDFQVDAEIEAEERTTLGKRLAYFEGIAFVPRLLLEARTEVEAFFAERGYADVRAAVEHSTNRGREADGFVDVRLRANVELGPKIRIRSVDVSGNEGVRTSFIRSRILVRPGDLYDQRKLKRSFSRLFGTTLFRTIDFDLTKVDGGPENERDLRVRVSEGPTRDYFTEIGWGSYEQLRGKVGIRERNLFAYGLTGRAEIGGSVKAFETTVGITDRWMFGTEWTTDIPLTYVKRKEPSFRLEEGRVNIRTHRALTSELDFGGEFRFSLSEVESRDADEVPEEETGRLRVGALGPFLEFDNRNDLFNPTRGIDARTYAELGTEALGGEIAFVHTGANAATFFALGESTVLAANVRTDWIVPTGSTEAIPIQERLFLGGENGVRSFKHAEVGPKDASNDPLGGEVRNFASIELRQRLSGALGVAAFYDYGNVAADASDAFEDFRPGVGFGLRYSLPIGPLRLDVAWNPDHEDREDSYVVHFAVGMPY